MEADEVDKIIKKWDQVGGLERSSHVYRGMDEYFKNLLEGYVDSIESAVEKLLNPLGIIQSGDNREPGTIREKDYKEYVAQIRDESQNICSLLHEAFEKRSEIMYKKRDNTLHGL